VNVNVTLKQNDDGNRSIPKYITIFFISRGGVYPPGAAFAKTSLVERLQKNGVSFTVV
jgi:hypothetical protein